MLEDQTLASLAAIPTPLPPAPADEVFASEQWLILLSICEVFVPSITAANCSRAVYARACGQIKAILPESAEPALADSYLAETIAGSTEFKETLRRRFAKYIPKAQIDGLKVLLSLLNTKAGSYIGTGSTAVLHTRSLADRTRIVLAWANSSIAPLRALHGACEGLTKAIWLSQSATLHRVIDYPNIPKNIERHPSYDFKFIDFSSTNVSSPVRVEADIVIVGSGCGSGVVADHLARSLSTLNPRPRILVLEKGYHFPSTHFPMEQSAAGNYLQEGGGGIMSDDGSIGVVAGAVFGGGGMINWSASLQPQHFVREDWARQTNSPLFLSQDFQECLDEVCRRMGVCSSTDHATLAKIEHNYGNQTLLEGARRLGLTAEVVPQNTAGKRHYCGRCHFGCASATKQGPANLWLPSAAEKGVEFIEGCLVNKIVWDETNPNAEKKHAEFLSATWTSRDGALTRKLEIRAGRVILSSGTLHSPLILHRSGLTPEINKHIGANLHLHPVMYVRGIYKDRVDPWDGPILTSVMTSLENYDGKGHGPKIEVNLGTPDLNGTVMPLRSELSLQRQRQASTASEEETLGTALDYKVRMAQHGYAFTLITIQRDHADATNARKCYVYNDPGDPWKVKIKYTPSAKDREGILRGIIAAAKIHYVMGAESIEVLTPNVDVFERSSQDSESDSTRFEAWLGNIQSKGLTALDTAGSTYGSAHQMSTCRMSTSPTDGVVDTAGKVWNTSNVHVADASILPSASGVNPMISTMGLSLHVAKAIEKEVKQGWP